MAKFLLFIMREILKKLKVYLTIMMGIALVEKFPPQLHKKLIQMLRGIEQ